jgi:hypothetical protein
MNEKSKTILRNLPSDKMRTKSKDEKFDRLAEGKNSAYVNRGSF